MTLFGSRVFTEVIELECGPRGGPNPLLGAEHRHTQREDTG